MKISVAFTGAERSAAERLAEAIRRLLPGAKMKETAERDGYYHFYISK